MRKHLIAVLFISIVFAISIGANAQPPDFDTIDHKYKTVIAGKQYERSASFKKKWGAHYRKEWATPVKVKIVHLDTLQGGLVPYEKGGGRQTKTLRLRDAKGQEYVMRSIDKTFGKALPEIYQGTFIENIINDQVSIAHPYSAVTISPMAAAAKIFHTIPQIIYIPEQPALDSFNKEFANQLYLFEQRPDENWESADNFGNAKRIIGTEKMLEELLEDNGNRIDQELYVRSRLFDMFIGDWGRHEDQWRWGSFKDENGKLFRPIPRDRDQAYTLFDGKKVGFFLSVAGVGHLESFDSTISDVTTFNFPARNLDRRAANEITLDTWVSIARELQTLLTDEVIENAIRQLPREVYPISGKTIISKLKGRRDHLVEYATEYYKFIAKGVDVIGSKMKEVFVVNRLNDEKTLVEVYQMNTTEAIGKKLIYSRTFSASETDEIRLFGMEEEDVFNITGKVNKGILVRVIGGEGNDLINDSSWVKGAKKMTRIYDTERAHIYPGSEAKVRITKDTLVNTYTHQTFDYDDKGILIKPGFISLTLGFGVEHEKWKKDPVGVSHSIKAKYSFTRDAINLIYNTTLYQAIGRWNLSFTAGAGIPSVVNFFGIGNESTYDKYIRDYFRLRSQELTGEVAVNRLIGHHNLVELGTFFHSIDIKNDGKRFITDYAHTNGPLNLGRKNFAGGRLSYKYHNTDHRMVPSKGFIFLTSGSYTHDIKENDRSFGRVTGDAALYIPVFKFISLGFRAGGASISGNPEFYQLNTLGSHDNLRGYRKWRFYGKQSAYANNELRFIFNTKSRVFNGKMGVIGFYDIGRVWQPGEVSDTWHAGYGGGIFLAPFNKLLLSASYGISKEDRVTSLHVGFFF